MPAASNSILLFDLDGTLTNPAPGFFASLRYALDRFGVEPPPESEMTAYIGPPLRQSMGKLLATDDREIIERGVELYRERLDNGGKFEADLIDGIPAVLDHFANCGHRLYVCTGKPQPVAAEVVRHFELDAFFCGVFGAKPDGRHADKGDLIRHIWQTEKITSPLGLLIGDTVFDMRAAKENRLGAVGVRWGFGNDEDLLESGADCLVSAAPDLIPAVEQVLRRRQSLADS